MLAILVATAALAGCGASPAPALNATGARAFSYDIGHRKFAGPAFARSKSADVLSLGQALCTQLDHGHSVAQLNDGLLSTKSVAASAAEDGEFVSTVVATLCPKYVPQIVGQAAATPSAAR